MIVQCPTGWGWFDQFGIVLLYQIMNNACAAWPEVLVFHMKFWGFRQRALNSYSIVWFLKYLKLQFIFIIYRAGLLGLF